MLLMLELVLVLHGVVLLLIVRLERRGKRGTLLLLVALEKVQEIYLLALWFLLVLVSLLLRFLLLLMYCRRRRLLEIRLHRWRQFFLYVLLFYISHSSRVPAVFGPLCTFLDDQGIHHPRLYRASSFFGENPETVDVRTSILSFDL